MYVEDVEDENTHTFLFITSLIINGFSIWKKHVEDRSHTPKGCNTMYVKDVEDGKRTYRHIYAHNFLNIQPIFNPPKVLESWDLELSNHTIQYCVY